MLLTVEERPLHGMVSFNHYWPPLRHNEMKRESPELFHPEEGLGGISEPEFSPKGVCIVVDNSVDTGRTLWMVQQYLAINGYKDRQIVVAAEVWRNREPCLPFEIRPLAFFACQLAEAPAMLAKYISPFLKTYGNTNGHSAHDTCSLQQMLAAYCKIF